MSSYDWCPSCGSFVNRSVHNCTAFEIRHEGEEYRQHGVDAEDAVEKWATESNEGGDYWLMNESTLVECNGKTYRVGAEPDIHYTVTEIEDGQGDEE